MSFSETCSPPTNRPSEYCTSSVYGGEIVRLCEFYDTDTLAWALQGDAA